MSLNVLDEIDERLTFLTGPAAIGYACGVHVLLR
jgi:hypothetical protein